MSVNRHDIKKDFGTFNISPRTYQIDIYLEVFGCKTMHHAEFFPPQISPTLDPCQAIEPTCKEGRLYE